MTNGSNNENFKNKLTKELERKIRDSVRNSFEKNIGGKGKTENAEIRDFERNVVGAVDEYKKNASDAADKYKDSRDRAYNKELKKDEERNKDDYLRRMNDVSPNRSNSPEALRSGLAADRARIQSSEARQAEAQRIKKEATEKAEKKINKDLQKSPKMKGLKGRLAAWAVSKAMGEAAYAISQKMAAKANAGGPGAIVVILITLILATITDAIDILGELGATALIVSVVGSVIGLVIGAFLWLINLFCNLTVVIFWVFLLGGGHKKWFWKRVIRTIFVLLFVESLPYVDILPFGILVVCWNWYDFAKDKRKAKDDLEAFENDFKKTRRIKPEYIKEYV